jgi:hypothetical protein
MHPSNRQVSGETEGRSEEGPPRLTSGGSDPTLAGHASYDGGVGFGALVVPAQHYGLAGGATL